MQINVALSSLREGVTLEAHTEGALHIHLSNSSPTRIVAGESSLLYVLLRSPARRIVVRPYNRLVELIFES